MKITGLFKVGRMPKTETKGNTEWRVYILFDADTDDEIRVVFHGLRNENERKFIEHSGHYVQITANTANMYVVDNKLYLSPYSSELVVKG